MGNFSVFIHESLERQVSPVTTMADLLSQLAAATGLDQDRIGHIVNGAITELSSEQIASIARALQVQPQRLQDIYNGDMAYTRFTNTFMAKEQRVVDTDELAEVIAATVEAKLKTALAPVLARLDDIEDRAMQRARFDRQPALTQEKAVNTGSRIPAFDFLTDVMHHKAIYTPPVEETSIEPERDRHIVPPAFLALQRAAGALNI